MMFVGQSEASITLRHHLRATSNVVEYVWLWLLVFVSLRNLAGC
jgi:hypothetical protein